ncbi:hypothetical protein EBX31_06225 [bacterium]|nr:hypothetical protein [bacterium]
MGEGSKNRAKASAQAATNSRSCSTAGGVAEIQVNQRWAVGRLTLQEGVGAATSEDMVVSECQKLLIVVVADDILADPVVLIGCSAEPGYVPVRAGRTTRLEKLTECERHLPLLRGGDLGGSWGGAGGGGVARQICPGGFSSVGVEHVLYTCV